MKIACLGDSLTEGKISYNWVHQIQEELGGNYEFRNFGVHGELAYNALQRLDDIHAYQPDMVLVFLGINDAIACSSEANTKRYMQEQKLPERPSLESFSTHLSSILEDFQNYQVALINIPSLGDDLTHPANDLVRERRTVIQQITAARNIAVLDIHSQMCDYLSQNSPEKLVTFRTDLRLMILTMARIEKMGRNWNAISQKYGLVLTTDTIHLNETSGRILVDLVKNFLKKKRRSA